MSDGNNQTEVLIEKEGRRWRWGEAGYFRTWNGLKQTVRTSALKALALPLAIVLAIMTYFFSEQKDLTETRGKPTDAPNVSYDVPVLEAPIFNEKNMPNQISQPRVKSGVVGRIKVFNLRQLSEIPVGSEAKAILESGATNGIVKARLASAMIVDGEPVLPEGTSLFGRGKSSEERLFVEFHKAIFPSGESFSILGQAFDISDKILGLKGAFVGTRTKKMGMAIGFGFLGGMADGLQTSGTPSWGMPQKKSVRDAALAGASKASLDQSQAYIEEMKNAPNIIEVKKGTEFYLLIDEPKQEE